MPAVRPQRAARSRAAAAAGRSALALHCCRTARPGRSRSGTPADLRRRGSFRFRRASARSEPAQKFHGLLPRRLPRGARSLRAVINTSVWESIMFKLSWRRWPSWPAPLSPACARGGTARLPRRSGGHHRMEHHRRRRHSRLRRRHAAAHLRDDAHRDVRCGELDRRRLHRRIACACRPGTAPRAKPPPRRPRTTCWSRCCPAGTRQFDAALAARLAKIHPVRAQLGAQVGREVAKEILEWRATDGWATPQTFTPPALPGVWQPTPPAFAPAAFVQAGDAKPFGLPTPYYYLPRRPPALNSQEYADARERDQGHRRRHQHGAHRRADAAGAALGQRRLQGELWAASGTRSRASWRAIASCR